MSDTNETGAENPEPQLPSSQTGKLPAVRLKRWRSDQLMSYIALFISLGSLVTLAYQNYLIQKQQYRSVLPHLMITNSTQYNKEGGRITGLLLTNNGVGPAFFEDITISYKNKSYKRVSDFFLQDIYTKKPISAGRNEMINGYVLPAGQYQPILFANDSEAAQVLDSVFNDPSFNIEIVYSSLYQEKWRISLGKNKIYKPEKID